MKALVYRGPGQKEWTDIPDPRISEPTDAIVAVDAVTICGTDLHILKGDVPETEPGRVLGHEAVGTVEATGEAVTTVRPGDRVLVSCITSCGRCHYCREGRYGQCQGGGGWILGHTIDGTQAEYVRVPFVDTSAYPMPPGVEDEAALMLADIVPTGYEVGAVNGRVRPGDTVAIVGAGPIGLAATLGSRLYSPGRVVVVDPVASRRQAAKQFGADVTVDPREQDPVAVVRFGDRRARGRCGHRGRGGAGDLRAVHPARPARRPRRQHRRARRAPRPCTSRVCGPATSRSRPGWSTPGRRPPC